MKISERVMLGVMRKNAVEILGKNFLGSYLRVSYTFFQCFLEYIQLLIFLRIFIIFTVLVPY